MDRKNSKLPEDTLDRLLMLTAEGELSAQEQQELANLLQGSPQAQQRYVRYVALHAWLEWDRTDTLVASPGHEKTQSNVGASNTPSNYLHGFVRRFARPTPFSMTVSALVIALLLSAMAFLTPPIYRAVTQGDPEDNVAPVSPLYVAKLTGVQEPSWGDDSSGIRVGAEFVGGSRIVLESGIAELTLAKGARIVLQGPATLELSGENVARLPHGQATAHVPERATGFKLITPVIVITDLGTEFAASVNGHGVETHVFRGAVVVQPTAPEEQSNSIRLIAGQAAAFDGEGKLVNRSVATPERFERRVNFVNVARGKPILPGSPSWLNDRGVADPRYLPSQAVDGMTTDELGTYWLGRSGVEDEFFTVDLQAEFYVNRLELVQTHNGQPNDRGTRDFEIWAAKEITSDGELIEPRRIAAGTLPNAAGTGTRLPVESVPLDDEIQTRYLKFIATTYYGSGCGLNECRVFGKATRVTEEAN